MKSIFCLLFITTTLAFVTFVHGQKGFVPGYVVYNDGDTVQGKINDRKTGTFPELYEKIKFRPTKGKKRRLAPKDIKAYGKDNLVFRTFEFDENDNIISDFFNKNILKVESNNTKELKFLIVQIEGPVSLYRFEYNDYDDGARIDWRHYLKRENSNDFVSTNWIGFAKRAKAYFSDAPDIVKGIENKTYRSRDIYALVTDYNDWYRGKVDMVR